MSWYELRQHPRSNRVRLARLIAVSAVLFGLATLVVTVFMHGAVLLPIIFFGWLCVLNVVFTYRRQRM